MIKLKLSGPVAFFFLLCVTASAGPFGLDMGQPISELDALAVRPGSYILKSVPNPHPEMQLYFVSASDGQGICTISAATRTNEDDAFGGNLRSQFNALKGQLTEKYGQPTVVDRLVAGALWDEPQDFVRSLEQNERELSATWRGLETKNSDGVATIILKASGASRTDSNVLLVYALTNQVACDKENDAASGRSL